MRADLVASRVALAAFPAASRERLELSQVSAAAQEKAPVVSRPPASMRRVRRHGGARNMRRQTKARQRRLRCPCDIGARACGGASGSGSEAGASAYGGARQGCCPAPAPGQKVRDVAARLPTGVGFEGSGALAAIGLLLCLAGADYG